MSSIGLICKADQPVESLDTDWVPSPLGSRSMVTAVLAECKSLVNQPLELSFRIEEPEESDEPRTISVSGVWGVSELFLIKAICERLQARFFDAEAGAFVEL